MEHRYLCSTLAESTWHMGAYKPKSFQTNDKIISSKKGPTYSEPGKAGRLDHCLGAQARVGWILPCTNNEGKCYRSFVIPVSL